MSNLTPSQMKRIAASLSEQGRYGDTQLVHVNEEEVKLLEKIGSGTINPNTGLKEFFFGGYDSIGDMFDGGGPGQSGDTYDNDNDPNNEVKGIARASNYAIGRGDANNGLNDKDDKGNTSFIKDVTGYDSIGDMFDGGGKGMSGDTYGHGDFSDLDKNGDGHISRKESGGGLKGGIDGDKDSPFATVANIVGLAANPVAYVAGKAIYNAVGDTELFGKKSNATTNKTNPAEAARIRARDRNNDTEASTQSTTTGETDTTGAEGEEGTYSEISDNLTYRGPNFTSLPERRKFIMYDYTDGTGKPVSSYNGDAKPFYVATDQQGVDAYVVAQTASNAIDQMVSAMDADMQDKLSGSISVQLTPDNKLALYVGDDESGYVEAVYNSDDTGMSTAMKDVANMLAYGEASGDLKIDAGYTGRVRSAQRFQGYDDNSLNVEYARLKAEESNYEVGSPLYLLWLERLQELEDEIKRRDGDPVVNTAEYSVNGVTRAIAATAAGMFA